MYAWESELPALSALSDEAAADAINAMTVTETVSRFGSFRTLAALLTVEEYQTVRQTLDAAAADNVMLADMVAMLKLPGDDAGNGGGIDLGNATTRAMIDQLFTAGIASKIKAYAEVVDRKYPQTAAGEIITARSQMQ